MRRLPIKGEVVVQVGQAVGPDDLVARALLPGLLQTIKFTERFGVEAREIRNFLPIKEGEPIKKGDLLAETKGFLGFGKTRIESDYDGTVESISEVTGNILVREAPIPVDIKAYIQGTIAEVVPDEGAIVETRGAMVQGIFGVGGERNGKIRVAVASPDKPLTAADIQSSDAGAILVGGSLVEYEAIVRAQEVGAYGLIAGGIKDADLTRYLGYDIGVAITGQEPIPLTIMVTEGFGSLNIAERTFNLLKSLEGRMASINGATQIRAGVIRPEIIAPSNDMASAHFVSSGALELKIGTPIRVIREPYFGQIGTVTELPSQLQVVESGTEVRVLKAKLAGGDEVCVPRANVEIIAT